VPQQEDRGERRGREAGAVAGHAQRPAADRARPGAAALEGVGQGGGGAASRSRKARPSVSGACASPRSQ
jgi:hypothetical protein